ncbi:MAG: tRNA (adenosine(37)-N6)-threonylcarbamoyltransferase complex ATPase subunit type 1 TsaE, partial [Gemmatimonadota bacterium]|nr:tRNA (adenosine(37)-N6)-threonylcarbamoyltransferase complex ATPase subunit type 1 TsaE [Gemmatimonadota bacterium]
ARAIGRGAGVDEAMPSPSYNLLFRYSTPTDVEVVHVDLYRIESTDELWELGWSELGTHSDIVVIEWPERAGEFLPPDRWHIDLSIPDEHGTLRDVEVHRVGDPPELAAFPLSVSATS